jgi:hypothetical protein
MTKITSFENTFLCLVVTVVAISNSLFAQESILIRGDSFDWIVHHDGVSSQQCLGASFFGSPSKTVAIALEAAKASNKVQFDACFSDTNSNAFHERGDHLYNEWRLCSRQYIYLMVDEAVVSNNINGQLNAMVAVSIAPFGLGSQKNEYSDMPVLRADAVFLTKIDHEWKISLQQFDQKILDYLIGRAAPAVYHSDPNIFTSQEQVRIEQQKVAAINEAKFIKQLQDGGASVARMNGVKESFALEKDGTLVTNWLAWKAHYNVREFNPPITYDVRDPWSVDFSDPVAAQRSYRHAIYVGDATTLYRFADEAGKKDLMTFVGDENIKKTTYEISPKITKYTVLFTATTKYEDNEYAMVFFREQEGINPKNGLVTFESDIFKKTQNGYNYTADLDSSSTFGNPGQAAKVGPMFMPHYTRFYQIASKSEFPEYYYKIDE